MKIGILTYHRAHNYGAMLQAYALRTFLQNFDHDVEFIDYWPQEHAKQYKLFSQIKGNTIVQKIKNSIFQLVTASRRYQRICQFNSFAHNYLNLPNNIEYTSPTTPINKPYDCVIVGSDQIWRNHITNEQYIGFDPTYFCQTIEENTPCISYAASMGIVHLVNNDRTNLCNYLKRFNTLLVREKSLQELIERMGYSAHVVLDPTLLLTKEQWNTIIPTQRFRQKKYVLYYELLYSREGLSIAKKKAKEHGYELLIMKGGVPLISHKGEITNASPIDFIHAIRDAEFVFATSFHGTAFSIIFEKQFITFGLGNNSDRVETLLSTLGIMNNYYTKIPSVDIGAIPRIDYTIVTTTLRYHADVSSQLLLTSLRLS